MEDLTRIQSAVLLFIKAFLEAEGYPPTYKEIANNFGWSSMQSPVDHVAALIKKGFLEKRAGRSRGFRILKLPPENVEVENEKILVGGDEYDS